VRSRQDRVWGIVTSSLSPATVPPVNDHAGRASRLAQRWGRPVALGLTLTVLAVGAWIAVYRWNAVVRAGYVDGDLRVFLAIAQRWLDTGSMYLPNQLAGPFDTQPVPFVAALTPSLYPPNAIYLFAPFLLLPAGLSAIFWRAIPLGILAYATVRWRPAP
jgi:hypothetical protein